MRRLLSLVCLLLPALALANDVACDDPNKIPRVLYLYSQEPTLVTNPLCSVIPEGNTAQQRLLVQNFAATPYYLKTEGTAPNALVVEMIQVEKDDVDQRIAAQLAVEQAYKDELAAQAVCATKALAQVNTFIQNKSNQIQAKIDLITNVQTTKDALTLDKDETLEILRLLARCVVAWFQLH